MAGNTVAFVSHCAALASLEPLYRPEWSEVTVIFLPLPLELEFQLYDITPRFACSVYPTSALNLREGGG